jgi:hypothetical protein
MKEVLRLLRPPAGTTPAEFEVINLLRGMMRLDSTTVSGRLWAAGYLDFLDYTGGAMGETALKRFSQTPPECGFVTMTGHELVARAALVHQFEAALIVRLTGDQRPKLLAAGPPFLWAGPADFQVAGVDLEMRIDEALGFEIVGLDRDMSDWITQLASAHGMVASAYR